MEYPIISEYIEAIEMAEDNLEVLNYLRPVLDEKGHVVMSSGGFAVVFKMVDERDGKLYAIKCFLKEQEGRAKAYHKICEALRYEDATYFTKFEYYDDELFVSSSQTEQETFPVLLMDWVEGVPLDTYVRNHIDGEYELQLLAYRFGKMASWLMMQPFAHGDLKPDNILVTSDGELKLVDYDGMYVPTMKGEHARELGSPDFRHPSRTIDDFDEHIDDFALVVIELSLKAISVNPSWLDEFGAADRLLFSERDYRDISKCEALKTIAFSGDNELNRIVGLFYMVHSQVNLKIYDSMRLLLEIPIYKCDYEVIEAFKGSDLYNLYCETGADLEEFESERYDFYIRFKNGCSIYFNTNDKTVSVCSSRCDMNTGISYYADSEKPFGCIKIPSVIKYLNKFYTVTGIEEDAFRHCDKLKQIEIPKTVQEIGYGAFAYTSVEIINHSLNYIVDNNVLYTSDQKRLIFVPNDIINFQIPNSVQEICDSAFEGCTLLKQIEIPNSVQEIGNSAFRSCLSLEQIEIPNSVQMLGNSIFYNCNLLKRITLSDSVLTIGCFAFLDCISLERIEIPNSVQYVVESAFEGCISLKEVILHNRNVDYDDSFSVTKIKYEDEYTIEESPKGEKNINYDFLIRFKNGCPLYFKFGKNKGKVMVCAPQIKAIVIEHKILDYSDNDEKPFGKIQIPYIINYQNRVYEVSEIEEMAFGGCTSLEEIEIPHSVKEICRQAFLGCSSLVRINIPNSVKKIGSLAFHGCTLLEQVVIPDSIKEIGDEAFTNTSVRIINHSPNYVVEKGVLYTRDKKELLYVPNDIVIFKIPNSVQTIGNSAFKGCTLLKEIEIPNSVQWIGHYAFWGCTSLVEVEIPNSVQTIGVTAFYDCVSLKEVILHNRNVSYEEAYGFSSFSLHTKIKYVDD